MRSNTTIRSNKTARPAILLATLLAMMLCVTPATRAQQPGSYTPQLLTYIGTPTRICDTYQVGLNVSNGAFFSCSPTTRTWVAAANPGGNFTFTGLDIFTQLLTLNTSLVINGGTALTTTNQSGTGSLCMTTSCVMTTPNIGAATSSTETNSNGGVFTNTQTNEYLQALINSCVPRTEFQAVQGAQSQTDALTGCLSVPAGATVYGANGVAGYANTSSTTTNVVAGYFSCRVLANNGKCWGSNPVAIDISGLTTGVKLLNEFDIQPQNVASAYSTVNGALFNLFAPGLADGTTFANAFGPLCSKGQPGGIWQLCFSTSDGASADFGLMGSKTTSANSNSQGLLANTRDAGNVVRSHSIFADNSGAWTLNSFNGKVIVDKNAVQQAVLDMSGNTAVRTYTLPDASGALVVDTATQTVSNKTLDGASSDAVTPKSWIVKLLQ